MSTSITIPCDTPLTLEGRLFAGELLDILDRLDIKTTRIKDIAATVVGNILGRDPSYFERFSDAESGKNGKVVLKAPADYNVRVKGIGTSGTLVVEEHMDGGSE